jgi:hypothetical protein
MAIMAAVVFTHLLAGFDNPAVVRAVTALLSCPYTSRQASHDLRRLKRKALIVRLQAAYVVTADAHQRFPPAVLCVYLPAPNALRRAGYHRWKTSVGIPSRARVRLGDVCWGGRRRSAAADRR